ncbi:hypothetical protein ACFOSD_13455 [Salinispirillum marinum]|uniref:Uncharacterized protein n=2 Tax=Saccharospirillaceae TaxID=255527 RepID=A0ABV8BJY7_9GAMM
MLWYLGLMIVCNIAAFLVCFRASQFLGQRFALSVDRVSGIYIATILPAMLLVGGFAYAAASASDATWGAAGMLLQSILLVMLVPSGLLQLKKSDGMA